MELKPGSRWKSAVDDTEVVVVRAGAGEVALECGGHPMIPHSEAKPADATLSADHSAGTLPGKRYAEDSVGLEVLATKGGKGSLSIGGKPIAAKDAKKLPASD